MTFSWGRDTSSHRVAKRYLKGQHTRRLYHGTSSNNLDAIRRAGVQGDPARRLFEEEVDRPIEGQIYLTRDPGLALNYAGRSARKFGGERMVLVFYMNPSDSRFVADEDWLASVRGFLIESGLPWYQGSLATDLNNAWALAEGTPDWIRGTEYGSAEHVAMLIDTAFALRFQRKLSFALISISETVKGARSSFGTVVDEMSEEELRKQADRLTKEVRELLDKALRQIAPSPWIPVERIVAFILDPTILALVADPGSLGATKREAWSRHRDHLMAKWPEWFGPEAALVSQGGNGTVAVRARTLKPSEAWIIDRPGRVSSYQDLGRFGHPVDLT